MVLPAMWRWILMVNVGRRAPSRPTYESLTTEDLEEEESEV
jgi:DNA-directed RNA polymerase subunit beta